LLGLSLAEVFILLLFCLLMLIAPRLVAPPQSGDTEEHPPALVREDKPEATQQPDIPLKLDSVPLVLGLPAEVPEPPPLTPNPQRDYTGPAEGSHSVGAESLPGETNGLSTPDAATGEINVATPAAEGETNGLSTPDAAAGETNVATPAAEAPELRGKHNWPPIINLIDAEGYSFPTGKAEISEPFAYKLKSEIKRTILDYLRDYEADVVEVVGHTDERPISGASNLDSALIMVFNGKTSAAQLAAADNVGLGMARAAAVAQVLQSCEELAKVKILPYSGGQVIERGDRLATGTNSGDRDDRRRIEIRVRRSTAGP